MSGQPDVESPPGVIYHKFDLSSVKCVETGLMVTTPGIIINQPNTFTLTATITNFGPGGTPLVGGTGTVDYYCENLEIGNRVHLGPTAFTVTALAGTPSGQEINSGPFNTGLAAAAGRLEVGTWLVTAHVGLDAASGFSAIVAAFNQTLLDVI